MLTASAGEAALGALLPSRPRRGAESTSQGHPRTIFRRALERGNLVLAEVTAREIGRVTIAEALELTALVARKQPHRYGRFAADDEGITAARIAREAGLPRHRVHEIVKPAQPSRDTSRGTNGPLRGLQPA